MVSSIFDRIIEQQSSPEVKQQIAESQPAAQPTANIFDKIQEESTLPPIEGPALPLTPIQPESEEPGLFEKMANTLGFEKVSRQTSLTPEQLAEIDRTDAISTDIPIYLDPELLILGAIIGPVAAFKAGVRSVGSLAASSIAGGVSFQTLGIPQIAKQLFKAGVGATRFAGRVISKPKNFIQTSKQVTRGFAQGFSKEAAASFGAVGLATEGIRQASKEEFDLERMVETVIITSLGGQIAKGGVGVATKRVQRALERGTLPKSVERFFAGRGGKPFQRLRRLLRADVNIGIQEAVEISESASVGLSAAEQLRLGQLLRGGVAAGKGKLSGIADGIRPVLQDIEKQLIKFGSLSPESVRHIEKLFQNYFPRVMEAGLLRSPTSGFVIPNIRRIRAGRSPFLRERGETIDFKVPQQASIKVKTGKGAVSIPTVVNIESGKERVSAISPLLEKGFVVTARDGSKITMFRDTSEIMRLTPVKRGGLGEIRQPAIPLALSISKNRREIAIKRFFSEVNQNPRWTLQGSVAEAEAKIVRRQQRLPSVGYSQIENDRKRFGDLAGKFVRNDIVAELDDVVEIASTANEVVKRAISAWKFGKVILNPSTHIRNIMSNIMLSDLGGLSPFRPSGWIAYTMAMQEFAGSARMPKGFTFGMKAASGLAKNLSKRTDVGSLLKEAQGREAGDLLSSTLSGQELAALSEGFMKSKSSNMVLRIMDASSNLSKKLGELAHVSPGGIYRVEEEFNKMALFIHGRRNLGLSIEKSADFARKYGIDYSNVSSVVQSLRGGRGVGGLFGSPFITFTSKAIPLYLEALVKNPIRAAKWPIGALGFSESSRRFLDETPEKATSQRELAGLNPLRWIRMRYNNNNDPVYLDVGYIFPFGDLVEMLDVIQGNETEGFVGFLPFVNSPAMSMLEASFNFSTFTEKPIDPLQPSGTLPRDLRSVGRRLKFLAQEALPSLTPGVGFGAEKLRKAFTGEVEQFSGRPIRPGQAISSTLLGLRTKTVSPKDELSFRSFDSFKQISRLQGEISKISRDRNMKQEDKNARIEALITEIGELSRELGKNSQLFQKAR